MLVQQDHDLYHQLDQSLSETLGIDLGFDSLLATQPARLSPSGLKGFRGRYRLIKSFQEQTLALFRASLAGEHDPAVAALVLDELPDHYGYAYHRALSPAQLRTPVFFRTDEPVPGKLSEIQCPGSAWGLHEQLWRLYQANPRVYGSPQSFAQPLAQGLAQSLKAHLGCPPVVHHLVDNASIPHGMRYFIQRTRQHGVRYWSYDQGVGPRDCNFVRSHDFVSLLHHNFLVQRMAGCDRGEVAFDLSPSALFDGKIILAWPFWSKTRDCYSDEVRALFPYTVPIEPCGVRLEDGRQVDLEAFCRLPVRERDYYVKYAGSDISLNWGSQAVFSTSSLSQPRCRELMERVASDHRRGRHWVLQQALRTRERVAVVDRQGTARKLQGYGKWSGFYGPGGLLGVLVFHRNHRKVHGSSSSVVSLVY